MNVSLPPYFVIAYDRATLGDLVPVMWKLSPFDYTSLCRAHELSFIKHIMGITVDVTGNRSYLLCEGGIAVDL